MLVRLSRVLLISVLVLVVALVAPRWKVGAATLVGPKAYYLALGDSLAYGYQPNGDWSDGCANDFYKDLQGHGTTSVTNMACIGETSSTFINGGCPYSYLRKTFYTGSQLNAAVNFITSHAGKVSPVTLDIGANDVLPLFDPTKCTAPSLADFNQTLATTFDPNFLSILAQLRTALQGTGDLLVMNYYDPYQNLCPGTVDYLETLNEHIANDGSAYNVPVADVFTAFGGARTRNPKICSYTWMCSIYQDIHPTTRATASSPEPTRPPTGIEPGHVSWYARVAGIFVRRSPSGREGGAGGALPTRRDKH